MAVDPTEAERQTLTDMEKVFAWCGLGGEDMASDKTRAGTLALLFGVKSTDPPRTLALVDDGDVGALLNTWKVARGSADNPTFAPPTLAERSMGLLVVRVCKVVSGCGSTVEDLKAQLKAAQAASAQAALQASTSTATSSAADRRIKLNAVLSQVDESEAVIMTEQELVAAYLRYSAVYGNGERPAKESEPTREQLSALRHLVQQGNPPYCDFSVFGPYGHRMIKKIKLSGYIIGKDGLLSSVELTGPTTFQMWLQSWQVFSNACVMLDIVDLGVLTKYKDLLDKYHNRYGQHIWALLYQADVRCRLELVVRIKQQILAEQHELKAAHGSAPGPPPRVAGFDENRPWNLVLQRAIALESYWREEVVEPAMMVLTKVSGLTDVVEGDARIRPEASAPKAESSAPSRMAQPPPQQSKLRPRNTNRTGRTHLVEDGKYVANRTGYKVCDDYNQGRCQQQTGWCPTAWDQVHQCSKCLGQHPAVKCPHDAMPTPNFIKRSGKGRGKGGGRKGRGKQAQY